MRYRVHIEQVVMIGAILNAGFSMLDEIHLTCSLIGSLDGGDQS